MLSGVGRGGVRCGAVGSGLGTGRAGYLTLP